MRLHAADLRPNPHDPKTQRPTTKRRPNSEDPQQKARSQNSKDLNPCDPKPQGQKALSPRDPDMASIVFLSNVDHVFLPFGAEPDTRREIGMVAGQMTSVGDSR